MTTNTEFLSAFFPDDQEQIHLRAFVPRGVTGKAHKRTVTRARLADDASLHDDLAALNRTHGIYFVVNSGGDDDASIKWFNAFFAENDNAPIEEQHRSLDAAPLPPSIRVETKKSVHAYWLVGEDCTEAEWREVQRRLIGYFKSDPKIKNPSRVMRRPGFDHVSTDGSRKRVECVTFNTERRYSAGQMLEVFPPLAEPERESHQPVAAGQFASWDALRAELGRRVIAHESSRKNDKGRYDCRALCHDGKGVTGMFYDPATNNAICNKGCEQAAILRAFGLPEKPERPAKPAITQNGHQSPPSPKNTTPAPPEEDSQLIHDVCMADVEAGKVDWLWDNRIAFHAITIIEGIEGVGKSTLLCALAAAVTQGKGLPGMNITEPGNVVWLSAEDDLARVLKPRLQATGADCSRVFAVGEPFTFDQRGELALKEIVAKREPKLVVIDPVFAYTKGDANKGADARAATNVLKTLAENFACAVVLVRHVGKSKGLGDPRAAGLYSIEWRAATRSVLLVGCDPDFPQKRAITQTKNNLGPKAESIGYTIQSDSDSPSGARFFWTGQSDLTAERILETVTRNEEAISESNGRDDAEEFLRVVLGDGPMLATDVEKEAKEARISTATLRRAKDRLGVRSRQRGFGKDQKWYWVLPEGLTATPDAQPDAQMLRKTGGEHLGANQTYKSNYLNGFAPDAHPTESEHLGREFHRPLSRSSETKWPGDHLVLDAIGE